jgi:hypothetical protein
MQPAMTMRRKPDPSDLSDGGWQIPEPLLPAEKEGGRHRGYAPALKEDGMQLIDVMTSKINVVEKVKTGQFEFKSELKNAHFVDANNGWAASDQALYKTADAGKSWERLVPQLPDDSHVSSFFFTDSAHGWLAAVTLRALRSR